MKIPPPRKRIDLEEALRLRNEEGLNAVQIAERLGFTVTSIRAAIRRTGGSFRPERSLGMAPHGRTLYGLWESLHARCSDPSHAQYAAYGARDVSVCAEWRTFWPFYDWALASGYRPFQSLSLSSRARTLSPKTCRWITMSQRMRLVGTSHGRRPIHLVTALGETKSIADWAQDSRCSVKAGTLWQRLKKGVAPELAVTLPARRDMRLPKHERQALPVATRHRLDWHEVVRLFEQDGLTVPEIARRVGASYEHVRIGLKARGARDPRPKLHRTQLREIFSQVHRRCSDESDAGYRYYGARGARVCAEWSSFRPFHEWALRAGYQPGLCITRRRGTRVYSPENCHWVTRLAALDRARPPRTSRHPVWTVEAFGETKGPAEWSRDPRCQVSLSGLIVRLRNGWRPEDAIRTPPQVRPADVARVLVTAFHQVKRLTDWARDRRCKVRLSTLGQRLRRGVPPEEAISAPAYHRRNRTADTTEHSGTSDAATGARTGRPGLPISTPSSYAPASPHRPDAPTTMSRRTAEERIAELQAEIERIKAREAEQKVKKDPALRHISGAVRAIDKAAASTQDKATRQALTEARATLAACLALNGVKAGGGGGGVRRRSGGLAPDPDKVLAYLGKHPGARGEEIAAQLGTDTGTLRPVLHRLRDDGKIVVEGKARATTYSTK